MKDRKKFNDLLFKSFLEGALISSCLLLGSSFLSSYKRMLEVKQDAKLETSLENFVSDIHVDVDELDISEEAKEAIIAINSYDTADPYLEALQITPAIASLAYTSDLEKTVSHTNTQYYDALTDTICWDDLTERIYDNTVSRAARDSSLTLPSKSYILRIVDHIEQFYQQIKQSYPEYDTQQLACVLEDFSLQFEQDMNSSDPNLIATTTNDFDKIWISYYSIYSSSSLEERKDTDYHEAFHVLTSLCKDQYNILDFFLKSNKYDSINISTPSFFHGKHDSLYNSRFIYHFLSEIYASLCACELVGGKQVSYVYYDESLDFIQATLGLLDDYEIDDILGDIITCDGQQFIQRFPVYQEDAVSGFIEHLEMLKGFDILLCGDEEYQDYLNEKNGFLSYDFSTGDSINETIMKRLAKLYFNNLIMLNEKHPNEMTVQDNLIFLQIFEKELQFCAYSLYVSFYESAISSMGRDAFDEYVNSFSTDEQIQMRSGTVVDYENEVLNYLSQRYQVDLKDLKFALIDLNYETLKDYTFPDFMSDEKKQFYAYLLTNERELEETYDRPIIKVKEK